MIPAISLISAKGQERKARRLPSSSDSPPKANYRGFIWCRCHRQRSLTRLYAACRTPRGGSFSGNESALLTKSTRDQEGKKSERVSEQDGVPMPTIPGAENHAVDEERNKGIHDGNLSLNKPVIGWMPVRLPCQLWYPASL